MIDINKLDDLFFEKLDTGFINYTSIYTSSDNKNHLETSRDKLIEGVEQIFIRESSYYPILMFDLNKLSGKEISIDEFLGSHFDKKSNSLKLSGEKKWKSQYFTFPYEENYKKRILESDCGINKPYGFSSCFESEKIFGNDFCLTNFELNEVFISIKQELFDKEKPLINSWNSNWINVNGNFLSETADAIWTLLYPNSKLTLIIFPLTET